LEEYGLAVFKYRMLGKPFVPTSEKETARWRKLHKVEIYGLYSRLNVIMVTKSRNVCWSGK
jgi:hypothetical protein